MKTRDYIWCAILAALPGVLVIVAILVFMPHTPPEQSKPPLIAPPHCEGDPTTGSCSLDLSDGREYVVYMDPTNGRMAWYEQDWRDGNP
jgi:hypothetical protein